MRHRKHNHQLGVKSAHRVSLVANLSCSLIQHGRIKTTLAKAKALRPSVEKLITLAKKAHATTDNAKKIHYRRLAIARLRNKQAVAKLFDDLVEQFRGRNGGYTRIYKLALPRLGDAADMALIEFVEEASKKKTSKKKQTKKVAKKSESKPDNEKTGETSVAASEATKADDHPAESVVSEDVKIDSPDSEDKEPLETTEAQEDTANSTDNLEIEGSKESK